MSQVKLERRKVPGFEGYYSVREDGAVFSEERTIVKSNFQEQKVPERMLKFRFGEGENTPRVGFSYEGKSYLFYVSTLMKIVFPEKFFDAESLKGEIWKTIQDFERYEVSNFGRIKAKAERKEVSNGCYYTEPSRIIDPYGHNSGLNFAEVKDRFDPGERAIVNLAYRDTSKRSCVGVARAVAAAFIKESLSDDEVVIHIDQDQFNNHVDNLKIIWKGEQSRFCLPEHFKSKKSDKDRYQTEGNVKTKKLCHRCDVYQPISFFYRGTVECKSCYLEKQNHKRIIERARVLAIKKPLRITTERGVEKICSKCDEYFPATTKLFNKRNNAHDGLQNYCKVCEKKRRETNKRKETVQ